MIAKNNRSEKARKLDRQKQRFSIRKLTVGAASVLIGLTFIGVSANQEVNAATTDADQAVVSTNNAVNNEATKNKNSSIQENSETTTGVKQAQDAKANVNTAVQEQQAYKNLEKNTYNSKNAAKTKSSENITKDQVPNTSSNEAVMKDPAVQGVGSESNGDNIGNIHSTVSIEGTNKFTDETSSSSSDQVHVNEPVISDLNAVITLTNKTDKDQLINGQGTNSSYIFPAWYGSKNAGIVIDASRVSFNDAGIVFGGDYIDSDLVLKYWSVANLVGSTGFNDSQKNQQAIRKDPSLIAGFGIVGTLKPNQTVQIIVPLKASSSDKQVSGVVQRFYGQGPNVTINPENFRDPSQYTDSSMTVDGLTDGNISNLADTNGNLTVTGQITNNGFIDHVEDLIFNLSNANGSNIHQVQAVLDHSKAIDLAWDGVSQDDIQYRVNGTYKTASQMSDSDWNNVTAVKVSGSLGSGNSAKVVIPVKLANVDQIKADLQNTNTLGQKSNRNNTINLSAQSDNSNVNVTNGSSNYYYELPAYSVMTAVEKEISKTGNSTIIPKYLVNVDGNWKYILANGLTFPHLDQDDFIYTNIGHTTPSKILFTDGTFQIKLDKIFNDIKDKGYSVNINDNNNQFSTWSTYSYSGFTGNKDDISQLYVQVQKIFDTKDLTLTQGDSWNSNDSLNSANVEFYNLYPSGFSGGLLVGNKDLKADGAYTYDLYDAQGNKIAAGVPVGKNVPTLAAGKYTVVYHYTINDNEVVSKTATITVNADQPTNPDTPDIPDQPSNPTTPTNPVKPETPENPSDNRDTEDKNKDNEEDKNYRPLPNESGSSKSSSKSGSSESSSEKVIGTKEVANVKTSNSTTSVVSAATSKNAPKSLPQTGEESNSTASVMGILASLLGIIGLAEIRRKKN